MSEGPFRNDRDADQARIVALEAELARSQKRVAEMEAHREQALVLAGRSQLVPSAKASAIARIAGAPRELRFEREFAGVLSRDQLESLAETIRTLMNEPGRLEVIRTSLTWTSADHGRRWVEITIADGRSRLAVCERLDSLIGRVFGPMVGLAPQLAIILGFNIGALAAGLGVIAWLGAGLTGGRVLIRRGARKRAIRLQTVFDALCDEISRTLDSDVGRSVSR
jgi:hypothetical protein